LKIRSTKLTQMQAFEALGAARGGGRMETVSIPLLHGQADLPAETGLEAVIVLSDMQYYEATPRPGLARRLISHRVAEELSELSDAGRVPAPAATGVVLAGDFYTVSNLIQRGGTGDVEEVWLDFAQRFRWVAGVAGNHDLFRGEPRFPESFGTLGNVHALHGQTVTFDGIKIAGISGICGNSSKPWRNPEDRLSRTLAGLLARRPDLLLLHEGPGRGSGSASPADAISAALATHGRALPLVVFGHRHWPEPIQQRGGTTLLSVDSRVVLFTRTDGLLGSVLRTLPIASLNCIFENVVSGNMPGRITSTKEREP
jgi:Icc protein